MSAIFSASAQNSLITPDNKCFEYIGRIDFSNSLIPNLIWSGSSVSVNFDGTKISGVFSAKDGKIAVYVDGKRIRVENITKPMSLVKVENLEQGNHNVTFLRASMVETGRISFNGIITAGTVSAPSNSKDLKIEFFGNSVSEGYAAGAMCEANRDNRAYDDHSLSYSHLTAQLLNADYHNTSICGIAVTDGSGWIPFGMQSCYDRIDPYNVDSKWNFNNFKPLICVMALGINDTYKDNGVIDKAWRNNYKDMVLKIKENYGDNTRFVFSIPPMIDENSMAVQNLSTLVKELQNLGVKAFYFQYQQPITQGHPIAVEHEKIAQELYDFIIKNHLTDEIISGVGHIKNNNKLSLKAKKEL